MCMYIYVYIYMYMSVVVCRYTYIYIYVYTHIYVQLFVNINIDIHMHMYISIYKQIITVKMYCFPAFCLCLYVSEYEPAWAFQPSGSWFGCNSGGYGGRWLGGDFRISLMDGLGDDCGRDQRDIFIYICICIYIYIYICIQ
jgi:hypothetical protein